MPALDGARAAAGSCRIRLFDADRTDHELRLDEALAAELSERQLLWIDAVGSVDPAVFEALASRLDLKAATRRELEQAPSAPTIALHGSYFTLTVAAIVTDADRESASWLTILAGTNVVLTVHAEPIAFLEDMDARIEADTLVGLIDSASFVAALLDGVITGYFTAVDGIEDAIDHLDARSLHRDVHDDLLGDLVKLRQRIARLRRMVSRQREVFAALGRADFAAVAEGDVGAPFRDVAERFGRAVDAVENGREVLLGSFDVYMTRTAQRTNEIMKTLTIVSILLLPSGVIAGFMGMNLRTPYSTDNPVMFWLVTILIVGVAAATLAIFRIRRWL